MSATDEWFNLADVDPASSDRPAVRVNWPNDLHAWKEPGDGINGDPIVILRLGGVEFRRPGRQLQLFLEAASEIVAHLLDEGA